MAIDHYAVLELESGATREEIRQAHKKLVLRHHPDKGGDEGKFREIHDSYAVLADENAKAAYDALRWKKWRHAGWSEAGGQAEQAAWRQWHSRAGDLDQAFSRAAREEAVRETVRAIAREREGRTAWERVEQEERAQRKKAAVERKEQAARKKERKDATRLGWPLGWESWFGASEREGEEEGGGEALDEADVLWVSNKFHQAAEM
ncbi:DnaJ domain-containing protein [Baffinella frigidus]|nr:DnaJ domain-containing protein [Cryptophyta sp. CCMP2293]